MFDTWGFDLIGRCGRYSPLIGSEAPADLSLVYLSPEPLAASCVTIFIMGIQRWCQTIENFD